ncbi:MAG: sugar transferase [Planctomycetes bacterium]|nr:sugar transferase [Planctomycetota bacterium]MBI3847750.1 sugar transferase [Planctomycetota bacterium]
MILSGTKRSSLAMVMLRQDDEALTAIQVATPRRLSALARKSFVDFKASIDFAFALFIFIVTLPILAMCALLVKLSSKGPVFFKQTRVGQDGKLFEIIKLRTMKVNAEAETGPVWARDNDPRVTLVGRFLRKSHLDELPQVINVLRGEMSLVGPRPERPIFVSEFNTSIPQYYRRLSVKPGITGLAQVRYKYDETMEDVRKKLAYDLLYIRKMCWYLDLTIIFLTIGKVLDKGAK